MDELKEDALASYVQSLIASFTSTQMKKILFIGLNTIKNEVEYEKLVSLNLSINKIIDKQSKNEQKEEEFTPHISIILKVEKNASLSETIPSDIIGKNICQYLIMRNITKLAQCDRKLAIICHSPIAIKNLRHRLDPYNPYGPEAEGVLIDGGYDWNNTLNRRRISSVEQLSVPLKILNDLPRLNSFQRVKDLTFYDHNIEFSDWSDSYTQLIPMPLLQTIAFINTYNFTNILSFLQEYRETEIIYQLQSIAFTGCSFDQLQDYQFYEEDCKTDERVAFMFEKYKNLFEFILPSQPNNLQMIKFQNSYWTKTDADECKAANDSFVDLERIKASLANLRAFVYSGMAYNAFSKNNKENAFYYLTESVLSNITSFKQLESVHVHSPDYQLVPVFLNKQSKVALAKIREVCMSISLNDPSSGRVAHQIHTLVPNLEKLCLVIRIENMLHETIVIFHQMMHSILCCNKNLKLLQIVCLMKTNCSENENTPYCIEKIQIMNKMGKQLAQTLQSIKIASRPLLFKVHVKSCHLETKHKCSMTLPSNQQIANEFVDALKCLVSEYLVTFPLGKIQFKWTSNLEKHTIIEKKLRDCVRGLQKSVGNYLRVDMTDYYKTYPSYLHHINQHKVYAFSVSKKDLASKNVCYDSKWIADCKWCCHTSWI